MTPRNDLQSLRTTAKRIARARRIAHSKALDFVAEWLQQPHWRALTAAWEKGWRPEPSALEALEHSDTTIDPDVMSIPVLGIGRGTQEHGFIDGHPYILEIDFEVVIRGHGWCISIGHAPSEKPVIEAYDQSPDNPIRNSKFREKVIAIGNAAAEKLRSRISADWPRRSTKPDKNGRVQHPFSKGVSSTWHCLHCDYEAPGAEMARNMWHCPKCSATPIDVFITPFWRGGTKKQA